MDLVIPRLQKLDHTFCGLASVGEDAHDGVPLWLLRLCINSVEAESRRDDGAVLEHECAV